MRVIRSFSGFHICLFLFCTLIILAMSYSIRFLLSSGCFMSSAASSRILRSSFWTEKTESMLPFSISKFMTHSWQVSMALCSSSTFSRWYSRNL